MPTPLLSEDLLHRVAARFRALSEPARLALLMALMEGERTVSELVESTQLSQANVSKHLQRLRQARFVARRKEGNFGYYSLIDPSVKSLCDIMCRRLDTQAEQDQEALAVSR